jgi:putative SOS response-associated peptidase YedK
VNKVSNARIPQQRREPSLDPKARLHVTPRGKLNRCIVPATSFCEYADTKPRKTPIWFALSEDRPLFAFAGLWTRWRGVRGPKSGPVEGLHELFGFLTTEANAIIAPIHPKPMPVILTKPEEVESLSVSLRTQANMLLPSSKIAA